MFFLVSLVGKLKLVSGVRIDGSLGGLTLLCQQFNIKRPVLVFEELLRKNMALLASVTIKSVITGTVDVSTLSARLRLELELFKRIEAIYSSTNSSKSIENQQPSSSSTVSLSTYQTWSVARLSSTILSIATSAATIANVSKNNESANDAYVEEMIGIVKKYQSIEPSVLACFFRNRHLFLHGNNGKKDAQTELQVLRKALDIFIAMPEKGGQSMAKSRQIVAEVEGLTSLEQFKFCTDLIKKIAAEHFQSNNVENKKAENV